VFSENYISFVSSIIVFRVEFRPFRKTAHVIRHHVAKIAIVLKVYGKTQVAVNESPERRIMLLKNFEDDQEQQQKILEQLAWINIYFNFGYATVHRSRSGTRVIPSFV